MGNNPVGLYIHVPFCKVKCGYCDFYSFMSNDETMTSYTEKLTQELKRWGDKLCRPADTLYFGGGTPSLLGAKNIAKIVLAAKSSFNLTNAELTLECNPGDGEVLDFATLAECGINRLSMGLQSAVPEELAALGRRHTPEDVIQTIGLARSAGITNISVDVMLGIPNQTEDSLRYTLDFVKNLDVPHVSAYLLKIEEGTPFYKKRDILILPDDDQSADFYLLTCKVLKEFGYDRYEISNFCKPQYESRHNNKYWQLDEYLGFGPSAHSFINGRRFYYDRDIAQYLQNPTQVDDGAGGDREEYIMLTLRTSRGLTFSEYKNRFGADINEKTKKTARTLQSGGFVTIDNTHIALTDLGASVSNAVILKLID